MASSMPMVEPSRHAARRALGPLIGLGASLARRGPMAVVSIAVCVLTVLGGMATAIALAIGAAEDTPLHQVPILTSSALAWGGGFLLAFSAAANALRRDRTEGIWHLFLARTTSLRGYLVARLGGLVALLAAVIGGGTLLTGLTALAAAGRTPMLGRTFQATGAAFVFALAFAAVMGPIAFAALGARARFAGYFWLFALVVLPEIARSMLDHALPSEVSELCALPSALAALRGALSPGSLDVLRFLRAAVALVVFGAIALALVRRDALLLELEREPT